MCGGITRAVDVLRTGHRGVLRCDFLNSDVEINSGQAQNEPALGRAALFAMGSAPNSGFHRHDDGYFDFRHTDTSSRYSRL